MLFNWSCFCLLGSTIHWFRNRTHLMTGSWNHLQKLSRREPELVHTVEHLGIFKCKKKNLNPFTPRGKTTLFGKSKKPRMDHGDASIYQQIAKSIINTCRTSLFGVFLALFVFGVRNLAYTSVHISDSRDFLLSNFSIITCAWMNHF